MADKVTSADIRHALMKHFAPPGWRVFFEVANATGGHAQRRIDALACGIWPSNGYEFVGVEIKVSRSDWQREMAAPQKAQELMRFCNRWYLAAPKGLVTPDELPATWGLLSFDGTRLQTAVKAAKLNPEPLEVGFVMAVLRQGSAVDMDLVNKLVSERDAERQKQFDQSVEFAARSKVTEASRRTDRALEIATTVKALTGAEIDDWHFDPKVLAAAYLLMKSSRLHETMSFGGGAVLDVIENLKRALSGLEGLFAHEGFAEIRAEIAARLPTTEPIKRRSLR